jgi:hypothetical protein
MRIVPACMHHRTFRTPIHANRPGREGQAGLFLDWERVHVRAQCDGRTGVPTFEDAHYACARHAGAGPQSQLAQMVGDQPRGAHFLIAEFRVLVDVPAPRDESRFHSDRASIYLPLERLRMEHRAGNRETVHRSCQQGLPDRTSLDRAKRWRRLVARPSAEQPQVSHRFHGRVHGLSPGSCRAANFFARRRAPRPARAQGRPSTSGSSVPSSLCAAPTGAAYPTGL